MNAKPILLTVLAIATFAMAAAGCGATAGEVLEKIDGGHGYAQPPIAATPDASETGTTGPVDATADTTLAADAACSASLDSDPANCGRCGHGCLGGACVAGQCQPVLLASGSMPFSVVIDDTSVYWCSANTDPGDVRSVGKDGSNPLTLATGMHAPQGVFVDATNVFWNEVSAPGRTFKANKDGSNAIVLSQTNAAGPQGIVADADWVYFLDLYTTQGVVKAPRDGLADAGFPLVVSGGWPNVWALAQDATSIYWTSRGTVGAPDAGIPGKVLSIPKNGLDAGPTVLAVGTMGATILGGPVFVTVDATAVYWTDEGSSAVMRVPLGGGTPMQLATGNNTYAIAVDATDVYFTTYGTDQADGTIVRVPKDGSGTPTVVVSGLSFPSQIAIDDVAIYWGNTHGGTVMKVAK